VVGFTTVSVDEIVGVFGLFALFQQDLEVRWSENRPREPATNAENNFSAYPLAWERFSASNKCEEKLLHPCAKSTIQLRSFRSCWPRPNHSPVDPEAGKPLAKRAI
jgi:hypothetical protein